MFVIAGLAENKTRTIAVQTDVSMAHIEAGATSAYGFHL